MGPLVRAARLGKLNELLRLGVAVFDKQPASQFGGGNLGAYQISSNTSASAFVSHFMREAVGESSELFEPMLGSPLVDEINGYHHAICPLALAGKLFTLAGSLLRAELAKWEGCQLHFETQVQSASICEDGSIEVVGEHQASGSQPTTVKVKVNNLIMALGATQSLSCVEAPWRRKALTGLHCLSEQGVAELRNRLRNAKSRRVVIVGGSHTAFSAVWVCLHKVCFEPGSDQALWNWKKGEIVLVHRSNVRLYYNSAAEAKKDSYFDFDDSCTSHSGRINPFSGLRGDAKLLYKQILSGTEKRVQLCKAGAAAANLPVGKGALWKSVLAGAEAVVVATGLQTAMVPITDPDGSVVEFLTDAQGQLKADDQGRLLRSTGLPVPNIFGIGVGHGHPADSKMIGGETHNSLRRADGVRMYVQLYGHIILSNLINLPSQNFPDSPGTRKPSPTRALPTLSGKQTVLLPSSPNARSDRAKLCTVARTERASTAKDNSPKPSHPNSPSKPAPTRKLSTAQTARSEGSFGLAFEASKRGVPDKPAGGVESGSSSKESPRGLSSARTPRRTPVARASLTVQCNTPKSAKPAVRSPGSAARAPVKLPSTPEERAAGHKSYSRMAQMRAKGTAESTLRRKPSGTKLSPGPVPPPPPSAREAVTPPALPTATAATAGLLQELKLRRTAIDQGGKSAVESLGGVVAQGKKIDKPAAAEPAAAEAVAQHTNPPVSRPATRVCRHQFVPPAAKPAEQQPAEQGLGVDLPPLGAMGSLVATSFTMVPPGRGVVLGLQGANQSVKSPASTHTRRTNHPGSHVGPRRKAPFPSVRESGKYARSHLTKVASTVGAKPPG